MNAYANIITSNISNLAAAYERFASVLDAHAATANIVNRTIDDFTTRTAVIARIAGNINAFAPTAIVN